MKIAYLSSPCSFNTKLIIKKDGENIPVSEGSYEEIYRYLQAAMRKYTGI